MKLKKIIFCVNNIFKLLFVYSGAKVFQTSVASTNAYKGSFFPQTIRTWNALTDSLIL